MNTLISVFLALATQMGTLKGHVFLSSPSTYKSYVIAIASRPTPARPGHMGNFVMRLIKRVPLDSRGNYSTSLAPGNYDIGLYKDERMSVPVPHQSVAIQAGRTTAVKMVESNQKPAPR